MKVGALVRTRYYWSGEWSEEIGVILDDEIEYFDDDEECNYKVALLSGKIRWLVEDCIREVLA